MNELSKGTPQIHLPIKLDASTEITFPESVTCGTIIEKQGGALYREEALTEQGRCLAQDPSEVFVSTDFSHFVLRDGPASIVLFSSSVSGWIRTGRYDFTPDAGNTKVLWNLRIQQDPVAAWTEGGTIVIVSLLQCKSVYSKAVGSSLISASASDVYPYKFALVTSDGDFIVEVPECKPLRIKSKSKAARALFDRQGSAAFLSSRNLGRFSRDHQITLGLSMILAVTAQRSKERLFGRTEI